MSPFSKIHTESKWKVFVRRSITISLLFLIFALYLIVFLPLACICVLADTIIQGPKKWPKLRCLLFFLLYLACEVAGVLCAFFLWLFWGTGFRRNDKQFIRANIVLQQYWSKALLSGAIKIFSMEIIEHGSENKIPGPYVLLVRHSSVADTVLPANLIANRYNILLRYVLKRELLWDPCLDIVGNRLPNVFIKRSGQNSSKELAAIEQLALELGPKDGILIFPEGTRFSVSKKQRILKRIKQDNKLELYERAKNYKHVLPPDQKG